MKYNGIQLSEDATFFTYNGKKLFGKTFKQALKFHAEGLAPVCNETGWFHINMQGQPAYEERYTRTFGYYFRRAAVVQNNAWFHIDINGKRAYNQAFAWCGNYQENVCTVRDFNGNYFHIDKHGHKIYSPKYKYAGDYKEGVAAVMLPNKRFKHIDKQGNNLNGKLFSGLGVFHKSYATAKDEKGWFHIDKQGNSLYNERYQTIEPFYNGFALVETLDNKKQLIDETGLRIKKLF